MLININHLSIGATQITQISPTTVRKTTIYESRRKLGQPLIESNSKQIEEKYEITLSSNYGESGLKLLSPTVDDEK